VNPGLVNAVRIVIQNSNLSPPPHDILLYKLDNDPAFRDSVKNCFKDRDYRTIRNLGLWFPYGVDSLRSCVTSQLLSKKIPALKVRV
jgi:hypothetical protein